jgi:DNA-binding SARP family transcriptional activator
LFLLLGATYVFPQDYGLRFKGQDYLIDERSNLNLTPSKFILLKNDFTLSFDIQLDLQKSKNEFGYIFRLISENDKNIDLLVKNLTKDSLILVWGNQEYFLPISDDIIPSDKWVNFKLKIFKETNEIHFLINDQLQHQSLEALDGFDAIKVFFGGNDYNQFINNDVPKMNIRDIKMFSDSTLFYHLPLNNCDSDILNDIVSNRKALVRNSDWILCDHQRWKLLFSSESNGIQLIAPNEDAGILYLIRDTHFIVYDIKENSTKLIPYTNGNFSLTSDHRAFYNKNDNRIYCYLIDREIFSVLNLESGSWSDLEAFDSTSHEQKFQHHNSIFDTKNNRLHTFGGYGQYAYNNIVKEWNINTNDWKIKPTNDSLFKPRYLAGSTIYNDTIYVLGGYGNDTGSQSANPQSYYNLLAYDLSSNSFSEKFRIHDHLPDMVIGNSICIDSLTRNYYALIYDKEKFNGFLKILKGNLDQSKTEISGDSIPYKFYDIKSFSSLYHIASQEKLIAYNSYLNDDNKTEFFIHSIKLPLVSEISIKQHDNQSRNRLILLSVFIICITCFFLFKKKRITEKTKKQIVSKQEKITRNYHIIFFGGFQVFDKNKQDITNKFSPLLKELFLLLWLHTFYKNKGLASEKLEETLWGIKSDSKARNNRSVNIAKLRVLLKQVANIEISKKTGYWKLHFLDDQLETDLSVLLGILKNKNDLSQNQMESLLDILRNGPVLNNVTYEWLDSFKSDINDKVIDVLLTFSKSFNTKNDPDLILRIMECVLTFDSINELAIIYKTRAHNYKGNHSLAKSTFEEFQRKYNSLYGAEFKYSFKEVISKEFDLSLIS